MSQVWTLKEEDFNNGETDESVWSTGQAARKEAAAKIQDRIGQVWDLGDPDVHDVAVKINDAVSSGDYTTAIRLYNDEEGNRNNSYFITVYDQILHDYDDASEPEVFNYDDEDEDEDEEESDDEDDDSSPFVATSPGAVCRGPCKAHSSDAYADRRDGTYECYQCKFMKGIFGS